MSVPAVDHDDEFIVDPDDLKMPESPEHRRVIDLIAAVAELLQPEVSVFRDMNWYPLDGKAAIAPDVMTLPAGTVQRGMKSYRQPGNGPLPGVAVEVASASDSVAAFTAKTHRYRRLGVPLYVVTVDVDAVDVVAHRDGPERWIGRPIPELGDLRIDAHEDAIVVVTPDGRLLRSASDMVRHADRRVEALEAQLRALGVEPTSSD